MIYQWKLSGLYPVDAGTAGHVVESLIQQNGTATPEALVEASRTPDAPLHSCFEWNDTIAANKYRREQAAGIIRNIVVIEQDAKNEPVTVRAFMNSAMTERGHGSAQYISINRMLENADTRGLLLANAKYEMRCFVEKYSALDALRSVIDDMQAALES